MSLFKEIMVRGFLYPLVLALLVAAPVQAQSPAQPANDLVLMEGAGVKITLADVQAALLRAPADERQRMLADKGPLAQIVNELYTRRLMAQEARKRGLDRGAQAELYAQQAVEHALSELAVSAIDAAAVPKEPQLTERSRALYQKDTKMFSAPALSAASHILVRRVGDKGEARKRAEEVLAKVKAGGNFEELAREYSEDPGSAANGGSLGLFPAGRMVKPFEEALTKLKPGQISDLVETDFGYHIIRLDERRPAGTVPFEQVRERLDAQVRAQAMQDGRKRELERLMKDAVLKGEALDQVVKANGGGAASQGAAPLKGAPAPAAASAPAKGGSTK